MSFDGPLGSDEHLGDGDADARTVVGLHESFEQRLARVLSDLIEKGRPFSLIVLDFDNFKQVVDGYGHLVGSQTIAYLGRRMVRVLRAGDFAVENELDLHGKKRADAEQALDRFLRESLSKKFRCVLVITGRGTHSEDGAVLKPAIADALRRGRLVKHVLAYTEANPGSYYVLLRRR